MCRFELADGYYTSINVSSKEMTKEIATAWAVKQVGNVDKYWGFDEVYEVKNKQQGECEK